MKRNTFRKSRTNMLVSALAVSVLTPAIVIPVDTVQAAQVTTFKDVPKSHWAYQSITEVAKKGLV
ncbi:S-layer homology domain-containing protein, partial [Lysinibacillus xylanilyticus]